MRTASEWLRRTTACCGIALLLTASGCVTHRMGDFTVLTNRVPRISDLDLGSAERVHVIGEDVTHASLIPWGSVPATMFGALDDALEKGGGDVMTDATVKVRMDFFLLYARTTWTVEGDVIKTRKN